MPHRQAVSASTVLEDWIVQLKCDLETLRSRANGPDALVLTRALLLLQRYIRSVSLCSSLASEACPYDCDVDDNQHVLCKKSNEFARGMIYAADMMNNAIGHHVSLAQVAEGVHSFIRHQLVVNRPSFGYTVRELEEHIKKAQARGAEMLLQHGVLTECVWPGCNGIVLEMRDDALTCPHCGSIYGQKQHVLTAPTREGGAQIVSLFPLTNSAVNDSLDVTDRINNLIDELDRKTSDESGEG